MADDAAKDTRLFGKPPFFVSVTGSKATGKSELTRFIIYTYARNFTEIVVISPTALNQFYNGFLPAAHIHDTYSDDIVQGIVDKQVARKKAGKNIHVLVVLDDILADPAIRFEKRAGSVLNKLFAANRHYNISLLIVVHKVRGLPPLCRMNVDFACFTRCMRSAWADIYDEYCGNMDKKEFFQMLESSTENYKVLMYTAKVQRPSEHYSCFKIPEEFLTRRFKLLY